MSLKQEDVLKRFDDFKRRFLNGWQRDNWLKSEVRENYSAVDGFSYGDYQSGQWENLDYSRRKTDQKPCYQINKLARVVDAISGFQVQNRSEIRYLPRELSDEQPPQAPNVLAQPMQPAPMTLGQDAKFADVVNDGIQYIRQESRSDLENSNAYTDMLICGVGAVDNIISYDENPNGEASVRRVAPHLLMWDIAARKKNMTDANAVASASLHDKDTLLAEINAERPKSQQISDFPTGNDDEFLSWFNNGTDDNLVVAYDFQWRVKEAYWQVQNTIMERPDLMPALEASGVLANAKERGVDLSRDEIFSISVEEYSSFKEAFGLLGIEFKAVKQRTYKYYRANIVGGMLISDDENYSQKGFSLKFMTGKWSETRQCWYGVVSVAKDPQKLLNKAMSDLSELLYISPHGGALVESRAVGGAANLKDFKDTWSKQREVTILADGAISGQWFMMKPQAQVSPAILQTIEFAERSILECPGLTPEFLGVADGSAQQAAMLQAQRVRQGLAVLATYADAHSFFLQDQGKLFVDMLAVLAENSGGLIIRNLSGNKAQPYVKLLKDQIATEYDLIVKEMPKTPDERQRETDVLLQIAGMLTQAGRDGGAVLPLIIENQDINSDKLDEVLAATQPPPPPQPDPINTELLQAQADDLRAGAALKRADAAKRDAEAKGLNLDLLEQFKSLREEDRTERELENQKMKAEIAKIASETVLNTIKAQQPIGAVA